MGECGCDVWFREFFIACINLWDGWALDGIDLDDELATASDFNRRACYSRPKVRKHSS